MEDIINEKAPSHPAEQGNFFVRQDAHSGVVLQFADERDAAHGGGNVDGAETSL